MAQSKSKRSKPAGFIQTLADLDVGAVAKVAALSDVSMERMLIEMGISPGTEVQVQGKAWFGDPVRVCVRGQRVSLRKSEAKTVRLQHD